MNGQSNVKETVLTLVTSSNYHLYPEKEPFIIVILLYHDLRSNTLHTQFSRVPTGQNISRDVFEFEFDWPFNPVGRDSKEIAEDGR